MSTEAKRGIAYRYHTVQDGTEMELYLMRHGIAEDGEPGQSDANRQLTPEGKEKAAAVLRLARRGGMRPALILSSPYLRAMQTAEIAAQVLEYKAKILLSNTLVPHGSPEEVWQDLRVYLDQDAVLVVTHEPLLGRVLGFLLHSPALAVEVKKAGIFRIDLQKVERMPHGILHWAITPKLS